MYIFKLKKDTFTSEEKAQEVAVLFLLRCHYDVVYYYDSSFTFHLCVVFLFCTELLCGLISSRDLPVQVSSENAH